MSTEYGIFNDEGCVESGFFSVEEAQKVARTDYHGADVEVHAVCPDHPEERATNCEECDEQNDDE